MLVSKYKLLIRFIVCWIIPTLIFSCFFWMRSKIIYSHRIGEDWQYERPIWSVTILSMGLLFLILCVIYFAIIHFFKIKMKKMGIKILVAFIGAIAVIAGLSMNSIAFRASSFFSSFSALFFTVLIGLSVPLTDSLIQKLFKNK